MTALEEETPHYEPESLESIAKEFWAIDDRLRMAYASYIEKPKPAHLEKLKTERESLVDQFSGMLTFVTNSGAYNLHDEEQYATAARIVSALIQDADTTHTEVLAEYTSLARPFTPDDASQAREAIEECLVECFDTPDSARIPVFTDHCLDHFQKVLTTDWKVVKKAAKAHENNLAEKVLKVAGDVGKIAVGVALGTMVARRIK